MKVVSGGVGVQGVSCPRTGWRVIPALALVFLAFGGYIKSLPAVAAVAGVDTTLIAAGVVSASVYIGLLTIRETQAEAIFWVAALTTASVVGVLGSDAGAYSSSKVRSDLPLVLLCLLGGVLILGDVRVREWWLRGIVLTGFLVALLALLMPSQLAQSTGVLAIEGGNTIGQGRGTGAAVVVLAIVAFVKRSWVVLAPCLALFAVTLLSGSRGPVLATLATVMIVVALERGANRRLRLLLAVGALVAVVWLALAADLVADRLTTFNDTSANARRRLWMENLDLLVSHPAGIGWGREIDHLPLWVSLNGVGDQQYSHNLVLEVGVEGGWMALIVLLAIFTIGFARQRRVTRDATESAMLGVLVFFTLNAMVSGDLNDNRGLWVSLGAALVAGGPSSRVRQPLRVALLRSGRLTTDVDSCRASLAARS